MNFYRSISISLFLLTGFFCTAQSGVTTKDSIFSGGIYRKFWVYVPIVYTGNSQVPLLLNYHGYSSNASQQQIYSNFMGIADTANFIIVHPEGTLLLGSQFWNTGILSIPDDVLFTSKLIDFLMAKYAIDFNRIYGCGMSNGGIMSYYLACNLPNRIAAIASVTGSMFNNWYTGCIPGRPFPIMEIHGTADDVVPYEGTSDFSPIDSVIKKWVRHNNCNPALTFSVPDINTQDNSTAVNYRYSGGSSGSSVELYKVNGGSHSWPGAFPVIPSTNQDFKASVEIWRFFRQYKLTQFVPDAGVSTYGSEINIRVYPNPSSELIKVEGATNDIVYRIFSMDGKELLKQQSGDIIRINTLQNGIYILQINDGVLQKTVKLVKH